MEKELANNLLLLAAEFGAAKGLAESTVSRKATGDRRFVQTVRELVERPRQDGDRARASFTVRKHDEVVLWFSRNWPEDASWPVDVPRPATIEGAA